MSLPRGPAARSTLVLLLLVTPLHGVDAAAAPPGTHTVIMDDHYQIPAGSVAVPAGWKFAGTVMRVPGCHGNPFLSIQYSASSPDGLTTVAALPGATWQYSTSAQMQNITARSRGAHDRIRWQDPAPLKGPASIRRNGPRRNRASGQGRYPRRFRGFASSGAARRKNNPRPGSPMQSPFSNTMSPRDSTSSGQPVISSPSYGV